MGTECGVGGVGQWDSQGMGEQLGASSTSLWHRPSGALVAASGTSIFVQPEKQCVVSPEHLGDVATAESWEAGFDLLTGGCL